MKLDDIRKLKVPELRFKLKELGLEAKGLKAELVTRLWSAWEAGKWEEVEGKSHQNDTLVTPTTPPDTSGAPLQEAATSGKMHGCKALTDCGTQTEPESELPAAQKPPQTTRGEPGPRGGQRQGDRGGCRGSSSTQPSDGGRGRAFYEFKEEIRYKR